MREWRMPMTVREHDPVILTVENIPLRQILADLAVSVRS